MANPPSPAAHTASPVTTGTILSYGVEDLSVTGILVDTYRRSGKYAKTDEVVGQNGIVEGIRMSDFRADVSISGRILAPSGTPTISFKAGDILDINGDKILIMDVNQSSSATGFAQLDISGTAFEGVTGLEPA
jgi:hypothetical protein